MCVEKGKREEDKEEEGKIKREGESEGEIITVCDWKDRVAPLFGLC